MKVVKNIRCVYLIGTILTLLITANPLLVLGEQPPSKINYQGYLTDNDGTRLNGTYNLMFQLYDAVTAGSVEWGPENHYNVPVINGIFQVTLGSTIVLYPNDFDEALFLNVHVNGESMSPRQPLSATAYAFGLVPGAEVQGDPAASNYALRVNNTGTATYDRGLYVSGEEYAIYAEEVGALSDVAIYSPDFIRARGYRSGADSYIWVPGTATIFSPTPGCALYPQWHGSVKLECSSTGPLYLHIPITIPGMLFGQQVWVKEIRVYYDLDNVGSYISSTYLRKTTGAGISDILISNSTNRTSTTPASYSLTPVEDTALNASSGPLNVALEIYHDGGTNHDVNIGMVRVRLGHIDPVVPE